MVDIKYYELSPLSHPLPGMEIKESKFPGVSFYIGYFFHFWL